MWQEAMATGTRGWQWIQRTDTYDPSGSNKDGRVIYEDLKVLIAEDTKMRYNRKLGTIANQQMGIILPKFQLTEEDIVPIINRTFFVKDGESFKVIGILDKTEDPEYFSYYLTLRRESIVD